MTIGELHPNPHATEKPHFNEHLLLLKDFDIPLPKEINTYLFNGCATKNGV